MAQRKGMKNPALRKRINKCLSYCPRLEKATKGVNNEEFTIAAGDFMCEAHIYETTNQKLECADVIDEILPYNESAHFALAKAMWINGHKSKLSAQKEGFMGQATDALADHTKDALLAHCGGR